MKILKNKNPSPKVFLFPCVFFLICLSFMACSGRFSLKRSAKSKPTSSSPSSTSSSLSNNSLFPNVTSLISSVNGNFNCIQQNANPPISCWGENTSFQLGNSSTTPSSPTPTKIQTPDAIPMNSNPSQIALGKKHACLSQSDGTIYCWGENTLGQLGIGPAENPNLPPSTVKLAFTGIANKVDFSKTMSKTTFTVGNGSTFTMNPFPSSINALGGKNQYDFNSELPQTPMIAAGDNHTCAVFPNGAMNYTGAVPYTAGTDGIIIKGGLFCWGDNSLSQLGIIPNGMSNSTVETASPGKDGTYGILRWQFNLPIEPGNFACPDKKNDCVYNILNGSTIKKIAAGGKHTCVGFEMNPPLPLTPDLPPPYYQIGCWGHNVSGQLGAKPWSIDGTRSYMPDFTGISFTNTSIYASIYEKIISTSAITTITAGDNHTCTLFSSTILLKTTSNPNPKASSQIWCWGDNSSGQLGSSKIDVDKLVHVIDQSTSQYVDRDTTGTHIPQPILLPEAKTITQIAAGDKHTCATDNHQIWCWGDNSSGQLGQSLNTKNSPSPQVISFASSTTAPSNPTQILISAGQQHSCASFTSSESNSSIYCWGSNQSSQLGNSLPAQNGKSSDVVSVLSQ